jgi:DNA mismatch endonuclease, patch repair protein
MLKHCRRVLQPSTQTLVFLSSNQTALRVCSDDADDRQAIPINELHAMTDVLSRQQRAFCMSRIRPKDSKPEMIVRRLIHRLGYRYVLHRRSLPGNPDLVFVSRRKVILVHGCFWHRHRCRFGRPIPTTRRGFWTTKLTANVLRDRRNLRELRRLGWDVLIVWECQTKNVDAMEKRVIQFLDSDGAA